MHCRSCKLIVKFSKMIHVCSIAVQNLCTLYICRDFKNDGKIQTDLSLSVAPEMECTLSYIPF